jgi:Zn-dependent M16 (insulinase) family peptidase
MLQLRENASKNPRFFTTFIQKLLLDNTHRLLLTAVPDRQFQEKKDAEFAQTMRRKKASLSEADLAAIDAQAKELERLMNTPNPPEALAALPQLQVRDLPRRPREIPTHTETLGGGVTLLNNDVFANGINYLLVNLDLAGLPSELYGYLRLYGDCVHKMGAAGHSYVEMGERVAANTGGLGFGAGVTTMVTDPTSGQRSATFSIRFLDDKAESALGVLHDFLFSLDPHDGDRLKDVLRQARSADRTRVMGNGLGLALSQAGRGMTPESALSDIMHGLPQVRLIRELADGPLEGVMEKINAIRAFLVSRPTMTASFTGSANVLPVVRNTLGKWGSAMGNGPADQMKESIAPSQTPPRDGLAGPMDAAYCTTVLPAPHLSHPDAPLLSVGGRLVGMGYVLEEVRFKGTAYGGGCGYNGLGRMFTFHSYRDPWVKRTLDVFKGALNYVHGADWTQTDVDRAIIGTAKDAERPIRPAEATNIALSRHLLGDSAELRASRHAVLLSATAPKVKRIITDLFEQNMDKAGICVVSSRPRLEEANAQLGADALAIQDIFES